MWRVLALIFLVGEFLFSLNHSTSQKKNIQLMPKHETMSLNDVWNFLIAFSGKFVRNSYFDEFLPQVANLRWFFSERFFWHVFITNELRTLEFSSLLHSLGCSDSSLMALDVGELGFVRAAQWLEDDWKTCRFPFSVVDWCFFLFGLKFEKR